ncbi:hypothetical protein EON80_02445 [bacterium]|nr:MAG: hypothetical protein EON80_02445 [bacterium]
MISSYSPTKRMVLLAVPLLLLGLLILMSQRRPQPLMGVSGPARISSRPVFIAFAPNGDLVCGSSDGNLQKYLTSEKRFRSFELSEPGSARLGGPIVPVVVGTVGHVAFSPDSSEVFVGRPQPASSVQVFDAETRNAIYSFIGPTYSAFDLSRDGKWAICGTSSGLVLVDLKSPLPTAKGESPIPSRFGKNRHHYKLRSCRLPVQATSASFSPDSKTVAIGFSSQLALFDVDGDFKAPRVQCDLSGAAVTMPQLQPNAKSAPPTPEPFWLEWSPDGSKLAVFATTEIGIYDTKLKKLTTTSSRPNIPGGLPVTGQLNTAGANLAWNADGTALYSGGDDVRRWSSDLRLEATYGVSGPVAISPDGKILMTASKESPGQYPYLLQWKIG